MAVQAVSSPSQTSGVQTFGAGADRAHNVQRVASGRDGQQITTPKSNKMEPLDRRIYNEKNAYFSRTTPGDKKQVTQNTTPSNHANNAGDASRKSGYSENPGSFAVAKQNGTKQNATSSASGLDVFV